MTEFNPTQDVPANDEQAMIALRHERPTTIARNLCETYQCRRQHGALVLDAYEAALQAHVDAFEKATQAHV